VWLFSANNEDSFSTLNSVHVAILKISVEINDTAKRFGRIDTLKQITLKNKLKDYNNKYKYFI